MNVCVNVIGLRHTESVFLLCTQCDTKQHEQQLLTQINK